MSSKTKEKLNQVRDESLFKYSLVLNKKLDIEALAQLI